MPSLYILLGLFLLLLLLLLQTAYGKLFSLCNLVLDEL